MDKEEIRRLREQLGLTQEEMARLLGVSHNTVQKWEGGQRNIPHLTARGIRAVVDEYRGEEKAA